MRQILSYILVVPSKKDGKKRAYKYPFVSSQLLSTELRHVIDFFTIKKVEKESQNGSESEEKSDSIFTQTEVDSFDNFRYFFKI